jgi:RNA polymerase sigma factor (sigma-70 family)
MMVLRRLKLEESDRGLLGRFARHRDGEAFSILMDRYADMVYTTCRRTLGDEAQAADAAQETFVELAKKADQITGSAGGWLHKVATRRAVDLIRQNASRRRREEAYAQDAECRASSWSEVEPVVDEALEDLPEDLRELLVLHFLRGRCTVRIAAAQGVSQPTISRRMTEALEVLRQNLRDRGIQVGLVPLQTVLLHSNHLAPEALRMSLGKIALVKAVAANTGWLAGASAPVTGLGVKTTLAAAAIAAAVATVSIVRYEPHEARAANTTQAAVSQRATTAVVAAHAPPRIDPAPIERVIVVERGTGTTGGLLRWVLVCCRRLTEALAARIT